MPIYVSMVLTAVFQLFGDLTELYVPLRAGSSSDDGIDRVVEDIPKITLRFPPLYHHILAKIDGLKSIRDITDEIEALSPKVCKTQNDHTPRFFHGCFLLFLMHRFP